MKKLFIISAFLFGLFCISSCKKYEEGPAFSLRSKKERVSNNWKIDKYFAKEVDMTDSYKSIYKNFLFTISKSGLYTLSYDTGSISKVDQGIWRFAAEGGKEKVEYLSNVPGSVVRTFAILKLKEKELWYYTEDKGYREEFRMKPQ